MAMAKTALPVTEIKGKFSGMVYRHDQCGQHIQMYRYQGARSISRKQREVRAAWRKCINAYNEFWKYNPDVGTTEEQKMWAECWEAFAKSNPIKNKYGTIEYLHAYQMFMSINMTNVLEGKEIDLWPPQ